MIELIAGILIGANWQSIAYYALAAVLSVVLIAVLGLMWCLGQAARCFD